jgi:hypothetical protein
MLSVPAARVKVGGKVVMPPVNMPVPHEFIVDCWKAVQLLQLAIVPAHVNGPIEPAPPALAPALLEVPATEVDPAPLDEAPAKDDAPPALAPAPDELAPAPLDVAPAVLLGELLSSLLEQAAASAAAPHTRANPTNPALEATLRNIGEPPALLAQLQEAVVTNERLPRSSISQPKVRDTPQPVQAFDFEFVASV